MRTSNNVRRAGSAVAVAGILSVVASSPATAAGTAGNDGVEVVNTETVQVYMDPNAKVDTQRVYEQLAITGKGKVDLSNPISTSGLRNLDGFGGFDVKDGNQIVRTSVDGEKKLRSVSDFKGQLPLDVEIEYKLDGRPVTPGTVVGKEGHLQVIFTVENVTGRSQEVQVPDGKGGTVTRTANVAVPMVGSLTTTAPSSFSNVASKQANVAGDGKGGTKLSFTMTLFPPIGSTTSTFGYDADIVDGVVPRVDISALPVNPLESPTFASAAKSYQGGADTGAKLTEGASTIDANLLKLRDGSAELVAGLIKLRDGAGELSNGLQAKAVPGSKKVSVGARRLATGLVRLEDGAVQLSGGTTELKSGTSQLSSGSSKLDDGAGKLASGANALAAGTGSATAGGKKLTDGLSQISGGLDQLADSSKGLPAAEKGITDLKNGVDALLAGFGNMDEPKSLIGGLATLAGPTGLGALEAGAGQLAGGLQLLANGDGTLGNPGLVGARGGVNEVQSGLDAAVKAGGSLDGLIGGLESLKTNPGCSSDATCLRTVGALQSGAQDSKTKLSGANIGLKQISGGLGVAINELTTGRLGAGARALQVGATQSKAGAADLLVGAQRLKGGTQQVRDGLDTLSIGVTKAVTGVLQLNAGAGDAYAGSSSLSAGLDKLDAGAGQLNGGAGQLAAGTGELKTGAGKLDAGATKLNDGAKQLSAGAGTAKDGSGRLADGADQLADGLKGAGDGSELIFGGLTKAAASAPAIPDGAQRLSNEGTKKLIAAGEATALSYGEMVAVMKAGAERAQTEDMASGAPTDAVGLTAYSYIIKGADGEGGRNVARALGGAAVLGAAGGIFFLRRRFLI